MAVYIIARRKKKEGLFKDGLNSWLPWESRFFFHSQNSRNPKKEALQFFEQIFQREGEIWRVKEDRKLIIQHKEL